MSTHLSRQDTLIKVLALLGNTSSIKDAFNDSEGFRGRTRIVLQTLAHSPNEGSIAGHPSVLYCFSMCYSATGDFLIRGNNYMRMAEVQCQYLCLVNFNSSKI